MPPKMRQKKVPPRSAGGASGLPGNVNDLRTYSAALRWLMVEWHVLAGLDGVLLQHYVRGAFDADLLLGFRVLRTRTWSWTTAGSTTHTSTCCVPICVGHQAADWLAKNSSRPAGT